MRAGTTSHARVRRGESLVDIEQTIRGGCLPEGVRRGCGGEGVRQRVSGGGAEGGVDGVRRGCRGCPRQRVPARGCVECRGCVEGV
eukprot:1194770-Prorocentrum_minimum.AAC.2